MTGRRRRAGDERRRPPGRRRRPSSAALTAPRPARSPRRVATESTPAAASRSRSARALAMASAAPASTATGTRTANDGGSAAGRPEPAEDRQQRDPDRERQPRPGRALEDEVVAVADRQDDDRPERRVAAAPTARPAASPSAAPRRPRPPERPRGDTRPAGIGLPGLRPRSRGASTRSLSVPIETWRAVIDDPEPERGRRIRAGDQWRRRPRRAPSRSDGNGMGQPDEAAE